jgi:hypothetical protein
MCLRCGTCGWRGRCRSATWPSRPGWRQKTVVDLELGRKEPQLQTIRKLAALGVEPAEVDEFRRAIEEKAAA